MESTFDKWIKVPNIHPSNNELIRVRNPQIKANEPSLVTVLDKFLQARKNDEGESQIYGKMISMLLSNSDESSSATIQLIINNNLIMEQKTHQKAQRTETFSKITHKNRLS